MPILARLQEYLDRHHVAYEVHTHPLAYTSERTAQAQHVPGREMAKVVVLRDGADFFLFVLPAPFRVDLALAAEALDRPALRIAEEAEFRDLFPGCEPGAMPPFGNLFGMPVWVDHSLTRDEFIVFDAGSHTETVRLRYGDFAGLVKPRVARFARRD